MSIKFEIEANGPFYGGWLAYLLGCPKDSSSDPIFQDGWQMGYETYDLSLPIENLRNQARMGRLYHAMQHEIHLGHISVKLLQ